MHAQNKSQKGDLKGGGHQISLTVKYSLFYDIPEQYVCCIFDKTLVHLSLMMFATLGVQREALVSRISEILKPSIQIQIPLVASLKCQSFPCNSSFVSDYINNEIIIGGILFISFLKDSHIEEHTKSLKIP